MERRASSPVAAAAATELRSVWTGEDARLSMN
jgi:hypothetical protein